MGNVSVKTRHHGKDENESTSFYIENGNIIATTTSGSPSSVTSTVSSNPEAKMPAATQSAPVAVSPRASPKSNLDILLQEAGEDDFTQAVLSFCAHMKGRMDALDNARLYEEFCSYAATHTTTHSPNMGVV